jgi:hypothetical protein
LIVALSLPRSGIIVLLVLVVQYAAMVWYGASYVPFGRTVIKKGVQRVCKRYGIDVQAEIASVDETEAGAPANSDQP